MPFKITPSNVSLLKDCPRCFWLELNKNVKRPRGIYPSLPSGMDRILKTYFDNYMKQGLVPPELQHLEGITLFDDEILLGIWRNNYVGIRWTDEKGNVIMGAIDNILRNGNKLIILDYKTRGFPLKEDTHHHYKEQLAIYTFLLRKNGYDVEDYAYLLFYHPDGVDFTGEIKFNKNLVKVEISEKDAADIIQRAISVASGKIPSSSPTCEYCKFTKQAAPISINSI